MQNENLSIKKELAMPLSIHVSLMLLTDVMEIMH